MLYVNGHHAVFQLASDPEPFYTFTVLDTSLFTVTSDQFIALNSNVLDYESTPIVTFGVSRDDVLKTALYSCRCYVITFES